MARSINKVIACVLSILTLNSCVFTTVFGQVGDNGIPPANGQNSYVDVYYNDTMGAKYNSFTADTADYQYTFDLNKGGAFSLKIKKSGTPERNILVGSVYSLMPSVKMDGKWYTAANYGKNREKMIVRKSGPNMWEIVVDSLQLADSEGNVLPLTVDQTYYFWNEKFYVVTKWKPSTVIKNIEYVKLGTYLDKTLFDRYNSGSGDKDIPSGGLMTDASLPGQVTVFDSSNPSHGAFTYEVINHTNTDSFKVSVSEDVIDFSQFLYDADKHGAVTYTWLGGEYKYTYTQIFVSGSNNSADGLKDADIEKNPLTGEQFKVTESIPYEGSKFLGYDNTSGAYIVDVSVPSVDFKNPDSDVYKNIYPSVKMNISNPYDFGRRIRLKVQQPQVSSFPGDGSRYLPNTTGSVGILTDENMNPIGYKMQENSKWDDDSGIVNWECNVIHIGYFDIAANQDRTIWYRQANYNWGNKPMVGINHLDLKDYQSRGDFWLETHIGSSEINCFQPDVLSPTIADIRAVDYGSSGTGNVSASGGDFLRISTDGGNSFIQTSRKGPGYRVQSVGPNLAQFSMNLQSPEGAPDFRVKATSMLFPGLEGSRNFFKLRYEFNSSVNFNDIKKEMRLFTLSSENFGASTSANKFSYIGASGSQVDVGISHADKWDVTAATLSSNKPWFALNDSICNVGLVVYSADGKLGGQSFGMGNLAVSVYSSKGGKNPAYLVPNVSTNSVQAGDYIELTVELFTWSDPAAMKIANEAAGWPTSVAITEGNDATVVSNFPAAINIGASGVADFTLTGGVEYNIVSVDGFDSYAQPLLEEYKNGSWVVVDQSVGGDAAAQLVNYLKGKDFWQTDYNEVTHKYKFTFALPADGKAHRYRLSLTAPTAAPAIPANWPLPREKNARNYIEAFSFPEQLSESRRHYSKNTVDITVRDGTDITNLTPDIAVSDYATISPASGVPQDFSQPVKYVVTAENGATREWTVNVRVQEPYIDSFKLPGQIGTALIDRTGHKVTVKVPIGTDLTSVVPQEIKLSPGATVTPSATEDRDFSQGPVEYTVTGPEGVPHIWSVVVVAVKPDSDEDPLVKKLNDAIADTDNWNLIGSTAKTAGAGYIKFDGGAAVYKGATYQNEILEMNLKTDNSGGNWPLIAVRIQNPDTIPYGDGNSCYLIVMKNNILELQKFSNGNQKYFINDKANTYIRPNQVHRVQFGAVNVGDDAVRLIFTVDGEKVFDYLDTDADRITAPGYFGVGAASNPVALSVVPEIKKLNDAIADTDNWNLIGSTAKTAGAGYIKFDGGAAVYKGATYQNEILEMNLKTDNSGGNWPLIAVRIQNPDTIPYGDGNSCYLIVMKNNILELQKFSNGNQKYFINDKANTYIRPNQVHRVQFGAVNVGDDAVRLIFTVDGEKVFDYLDTDADRITAPGYFGVGAASNPVALSVVPEIKKLNDAIADTDNWNLIGSTAKTAGAGYIKFDGGAAVYKGATYQNEILEMNLKTDNSGGNWPLIAVRIQNPDTIPYGDGNSCYLIVMKNNILELQKFSNGNQKYFINDKANTYIRPNQVHRVQFGAVNVGDDAVRLIFTVDGEKVFDYLDTDADRITAPGYFGVGAASNPVALSVVPEIKKLNDAIADTDNWNLIGSTAKTAGAGYIKFDGGAAVYKGATYQNEILEMNLKTDNSGGNWPLIAVRIQNPDTIPYGDGNSCYLIVMKNNILELQKFSNGNQKYFINDKANTYIRPNQVHRVQFGAVNVGDDAVRLIFTVDGEKVFDYLDTDADRITAPGYFGVGAASNPVTLSDTFTLSKDEVKIDKSANDIISFTVPGQIGDPVINNTDHTVSIKVASDADRRSMTPTISVSYGASVVPASGEAQDFRNPVVYTVTAADGSVQNWVVTVNKSSFAEGKVYNATSPDYGIYYRKENAFDNNLNTFWAPKELTNQWISVDFGAPSKFNRIVLTEGSGRSDKTNMSWLRDYVLQVSDDGTNWTDIPGTKVTGAACHVGALTKVFKIPDTTSNMLRLKIDNAIGGIYVYELGVYYDEGAVYTTPVQPAPVEMPVLQQPPAQPPQPTETVTIGPADGGTVVINDTFNEGNGPVEIISDTFNEDASADVNVINDSFDNEAGNSSLNNWSNSTGVIVALADNPDASNKALQMTLDTSTVGAWPELKRTMDPQSGDILIQFKLNIADNSKFNVVPRIWGAGQQIANLTFWPEASPADTNRIIMAYNGGQTDVPGSNNLLSGQWYDVSIEINTDTQKYTAWVGNKPADVTYYDFISETNVVDTVSYILQGNQNGTVVDPNGIKLDDFKVTRLAQQSQTDVQWTGSTGVVKTYVDNPDASNKALQMTLDTSTVGAWPELKRTMDPQSGDILIQFKLNIADNSKFNVVPRIWGAGQQIANLTFWPEASPADTNRIIMAYNGGQTDVPGSNNLLSGQWYDVSIEINTDTQKYTAWVGNKPADVTYYDFISETNVVDTVSYILQGNQNGTVVDPNGIKLDDFKVTRLAQQSQTDVQWTGSTGVVKTYVDNPDASNKALQMTLDTSTVGAWPELKRTMDPQSGDILIQFKLNIADNSKFNVVPRIWGAGQQIANLTFWPEASPADTNRIIMAYNGGQTDVPGSNNLLSGQWYDVSIEINTDTQKYTAWVGNKPADVTYYDFISETNVVDTVSYILQGNQNGTVVDPNGIKLDDFKVTKLPDSSTTTKEVSTLQLWLKADSGLNKDETGKVSSWMDQSENARILVQDRADRQPLLVDDAINGNPALKFDGRNDRLSTVLNKGMKEFTIAFVLKPNSTINYNQQIGCGWGTFLFHANEGGALSVGINADGGRITEAEGTGKGTLAPGRWDRFIFTYGNGTGTLYLNGKKIASKAMPAPGNWGTFFIGLADPNTIDGELAELLLYSTLLSENDVSGLDDYLNGKYPLTGAAYESGNAVITGIVPVYVSTKAGVAPVLPETVTVYYSDGTIGQLPVSWESIAPAAYSRKGSFTVEGSVSGTSIKAIAHVTVNNPPIPPTATPTPESEPVAPGTVKPSKIDFDPAKGTVKVSVNEQELKSAIKTAVTDAKGVKTVVVNVLAEKQEAKEYILEVPSTALTEKDSKVKIEVNTPLGTITAPSDMLTSENLRATDVISLSIAVADISGLSKLEQEAIGSRPVIEIGINVNGKAMPWNNPDKPVTISIPYPNLTAEEQADPEKITIWYIDGSGNPVPVPNAVYDSASKSVTFTTTHFSKYAVVFVKKTFDDIGTCLWAKKQIEVVASKGIIDGATSTTFEPLKNITRGDFVMYLVNALGLTASFDTNFKDISVGDEYYKALGIAKKLGIAQGVGDNRFNPLGQISRQDMMVLTVRALKAAGKKTAEADIAVLGKYADVGEISDYAKSEVAALVKSGIIQGSNNNLNPRGKTTRAEAAAVVYRIINMKE